jgi:hypothetical protein
MKSVVAAAAFLLLSPPTYAQVSVIQADYEEVITDLEGRARFTEIGRHTFDESGQHRHDWTTRYGESVSEIVLPERNERLTINHETRTIAVGTSNEWFSVPDLVQPRVTAADLVAGANRATSCFFRLVVAELTPGVQTRIGGGRALPIGVREHGPVTLQGHRVASPGSICRQPSTTERWTYAADPGIRTGGPRSSLGRSRSRSAMSPVIRLEHTTTVEIDGRPQVIAHKRLTAITRSTVDPGVFSVPAGYATRNAFQ